MLPFDENYEWRIMCKYMKNTKKYNCVTWHFFSYVLLRKKVGRIRVHHTKYNMSISYFHFPSTLFWGYRMSLWQLHNLSNLIHYILFILSELLFHFTYFDTGKYRNIEVVLVRIRNDNQCKTIAYISFKIVFALLPYLYIGKRQKRSNTQRDVCVSTIAICSHESKRFFLLSCFVVKRIS